MGNGVRLARLPYTVRRHEYEHPGTHVRVTITCLGYPTAGLHPAGGAIALLMPPDDLPQWRLGRMVEVEINAR